ncbi:hypothetical protein QTO34_005483 [Cnephaeus nilssonii]|uniref:Uncharacterized protein n=1 Tax=Cnephaeus nilssonii TaxID=3371016 RepID=A0AA40HNI5_CNENI|nr:hypothetical protein QTO34_005483 [Eptesicus nilssonii]
MERIRTWKPGNQAATFYNCPFPSHSDREIGEDTMFSCCLPVSQGRGLKRGSDESRFRSGCCWFRTQRRPLSPLTQLEPEVTQGDPGAVGHTTEGQSRPEVHMTSWGSGEPGPLSGRRWSPPQKPIRFRRPPSWKLLNQQRRIALRNSFLEPTRFCKRFPMCDAYLEHQAHVNHTGPEDLQEAEPKAWAQEAEETPVVTPEVHLEMFEAELEVWAPPEVLPPPSATPTAAVEPGRPGRHLQT